MSDDHIDSNGLDVLERLALNIEEVCCVRRIHGPNYHQKVSTSASASANVGKQQQHDDYVSSSTTPKSSHDDFVTMIKKEYGNTYAYYNKTVLNLTMRLKQLVYLSDCDGYQINNIDDIDVSEYGDVMVVLSDEEELCTVLASLLSLIANIKDDILCKHVLTMVACSGCLTQLVWIPFASSYETSVDGDDCVDIDDNNDRVRAIPSNATNDISSDSCTRQFPCTVIRSPSCSCPFDAIKPLSTDKLLYESTGELYVQTKTSIGQRRQLLESVSASSIFRTASHGTLNSLAAAAAAADTGTDKKMFAPLVKTRSFNIDLQSDVWSSNTSPTKSKSNRNSVSEASFLAVRLLLLVAAREDSSNAWTCVIIDSGVSDIFVSYLGPDGPDINYMVHNAFAFDEVIALFEAVCRNEVMRDVLIGGSISVLPGFVVLLEKLSSLILAGHEEDSTAIASRRHWQLILLIVVPLNVLCSDNEDLCSNLAKNTNLINCLWLVVKASIFVGDASASSMCASLSLCVILEVLASAVSLLVVISDVDMFFAVEIGRSLVAIGGNADTGLFDELITWCPTLIKLDADGTGLLLEKSLLKLCDRLLKHRIGAISTLLSDPLLEINWLVQSFWVSSGSCVIHAGHALGRLACAGDAILTLLVLERGLLILLGLLNLSRPVSVALSLRALLHLKPDCWAKHISQQQREFSQTSSGSPKFRRRHYAAKIAISGYPSTTTDVSPRKSSFATMRLPSQKLNIYEKSEKKADVQIALFSRQISLIASQIDFLSLVDSSSFLNDDIRNHEREPVEHGNCDVKGDVPVNVEELTSSCKGTVNCGKSEISVEEKSKRDANDGLTFVLGRLDSYWDLALSEGLVSKLVAVLAACLRCHTKKASTKPFLEEATVISVKSRGVDVTKLCLFEFDIETTVGSGNLMADTFPTSILQSMAESVVDMLSYLIRTRQHIRREALELGCVSLLAGAVSLFSSSTSDLASFSMETLSTLVTDQNVDNGSQITKDNRNSQISLNSGHSRYSPWSLHDSEKIRTPILTFFTADNSADMATPYALESPNEAKQEKTESGIELYNVSLKNLNQCGISGSTIDHIFPHITSIVAQLSCGSIQVIKHVTTIIAKLLEGSPPPENLTTFDGDSDSVDGVSYNDTVVTGNSDDMVTEEDLCGDDSSISGFNFQWKQWIECETDNEDIHSARSREAPVKHRMLAEPCDSISAFSTNTSTISDSAIIMPKSTIGCIENTISDYSAEGRRRSVARAGGVSLLMTVFFEAEPVIGDPDFESITIATRVSLDGLSTGLYNACAQGRLDVVQDYLPLFPSTAQPRSHSRNRNVRERLSNRDNRLSFYRSSGAISSALDLGPHISIATHRCFHKISDHILRWLLPEVHYTSSYRNINWSSLLLERPPRLLWRNSSFFMVQSLDLSKNRLSDVTPIFLCLPNLRSLDLSNNNLTFLPTAASIEEQISHHGKRSFFKSNHRDTQNSEWACRGLAVFRVAHNSIKILPEPLFSLPSLLTLVASHNIVTALECNIYRSPIQVLDLTGNPPTSEVLNSIALQLPSIRTLIWSQQNCANRNKKTSETHKRANIENRKLKLSSSIRWGLSMLLDLVLTRIDLVTPDHVFPSDVGSVLPSLQKLSLNATGISEVPLGVCSIISLTSLNLSDNPRMRSLRVEMGSLTRLWELFLDGLHLHDPPSNVLQRKSGRTKAIIYYLRAKLREAAPYRRMKLMLVGKEARGKSSLLAALRKERRNNDIATVGVDVGEWSYRPSLFEIPGRQLPRITFSTWDFAGQEVYKATHQVFLSRRALYLALWKVTDGELGIASLKPWLQSIQARVPSAPVLVIGTFLDQLYVDGSNETSVVEAHVARLHDSLREMCVAPGFPRIVDMTVVSTTTGKGIKKLANTIYYQALEERDARGKGPPLIGQMFPASYLALEDAIRQKATDMKIKMDAIMKASDSQRSVSDLPSSIVHEKGDKNSEWGEKISMFHPPILTHDEFVRMVQQTPGNDINDSQELELATTFLHETGVLLHYPDPTMGLGNLYFIDPHYLCSIMARMITVREHNYFIEAGKFHVRNMAWLFRDYFLPPRFFPQYLKLLNRFEITFPLDADTLIIPSMLPEERPAMSAMPAKDCFRRRYEMAYVPSGFWGRLIARLMAYLRVKLTNFPKDANASSTSSCFNSTATVTCKDDNNRAADPIAGGGGKWLCWRYGLLYHDASILLLVEKLHPAPFAHAEATDGLEISVSSWGSGAEIFGQLVDHVDTVLDEWYPGLSEGDFRGPLVRRLIPCSECISRGDFYAHMFFFGGVLETAREQDYLVCPKHAEWVPLATVAPDLLLDGASDLVLSASQFYYERTDENRLGDGLSASVYKGVLARRHIAVKEFFGNENNVNSGTASGSFDYDANGEYSHMINPNSVRLRNAYKDMRQETALMRNLHHPFVVGLLGICLKPLCLLMELAPLGSLSCYLKSVYTSGTWPSTYLSHRIARQCAVALKYLHDSRIIYRDLKSDNVLMWSDSPVATVNVKLSDYGISKFAAPSGIRGFQGTPGFIAPEILKFKGSEEFSEKVDIFSYAMLLYELISCGRTPFADEFSNRLEMNDAILNGYRPDISDAAFFQCNATGMSAMNSSTTLHARSRPSRWWSQSTGSSKTLRRPTVFSLPPPRFPWREIMHLCWRTEPSERPSAAEIVESLTREDNLLMRSAEFLDRMCHFAVSLIRTLERQRYQREIWIATVDNRGTVIEILFPDSTLSPSSRENFFLTEYRLTCMCVVPNVVAADSVQTADCVWVGTPHNLVAVSVETRCEIASLSMQHSPLCIVHDATRNRAIVGTASGKLLTHANSILGENLQEIHVGDAPISALVECGDWLWCGCSDTIVLVDSRTLERAMSWRVDVMPHSIISDFDNNGISMSNDGRRIVSELCSEPGGVWSATRHVGNASPDCTITLKLWSSDTHELIRELCYGQDPDHLIPGEVTSMTVIRGFEISNLEAAVSSTTSREDGDDSSVMMNELSSKSIDKVASLWVGTATGMLLVFDLDFNDSSSSKKHYATLRSHDESDPDDTINPVIDIMKSNTKSNIVEDFDADGSSLASAFTPPNHRRRLSKMPYDSPNIRRITSQRNSLLVPKKNSGSATSLIAAASDSDVDHAYFQKSDNFIQKDEASLSTENTTRASIVPSPRPVLVASRHMAAIRFICYMAHLPTAVCSESDVISSTIDVCSSDDTFPTMSGNYYRKAVTTASLKEAIVVTGAAGWVKSVVIPEQRTACVIRWDADAVSRLRCLTRDKSREAILVERYSSFLQPLSNGPSFDTSLLSRRNSHHDIDKMVNSPSKQDVSIDGGSHFVGDPNSTNQSKGINANEEDSPFSIPMPTEIQSVPITILPLDSAASFSVEAPITAKESLWSGYSRMSGSGICLSAGFQVYVTAPLHYDRLVLAVARARNVNVASLRYCDIHGNFHILETQSDIHIWLAEANALSYSEDTSEQDLLSTHLLSGGMTSNGPRMCSNGSIPRTVSCPGRRGLTLFYEVMADYNSSKGNEEGGSSDRSLE